MMHMFIAYIVHYYHCFTTYRWFCGVSIQLRPHSVFIFFRWIPRDRIARSYGSFVFYFLRDLHGVFHSGCVGLHCCQQCTGVPFAPHACRNLFLVFSMLVILAGVRWCAVVVLVWISLMIGDFEHPSTWLLAICMSSKYPLMGIYTWNQNNKEIKNKQTKKWAHRDKNQLVVTGGKGSGDWQDKWRGSKRTNLQL